MIPEAVAKRWGPMWAVGHHPERPWWTYLGPYGTDDDGNKRDGYHYSRRGGSRSVWAAHGYIDDTLAAYDVEHPLPRPPAMPGQVWLRADGREYLVTGGDTTPDLLPSEFVALLAGPSPWGRDVPWCAP